MKSVDRGRRVVTPSEVEGKKQEQFAGCGWALRLAVPVFFIPSINQHRVYMMVDQHESCTQF